MDTDSSMIAANDAESSESATEEMEPTEVGCGTSQAEPPGFETLSFDLHVYIFRKLDITNQLKCRSVCSRWNSILCSPAALHRVEIDSWLLPAHQTGRYSGKYLKDIEQLLGFLANEHTKVVVFIPDDSDERQCLLDLQICKRLFGYSSLFSVVIVHQNVDLPTLLNLPPTVRRIILIDVSLQEISSVHCPGFAYTLVIPIAKVYVELDCEDGLEAGLFRMIEDCCVRPTREEIWQIDAKLMRLAGYAKQKAGQVLLMREPAVVKQTQKSPRTVDFGLVDLGLLKASTLRELQMF